MRLEPPEWTVLGAVAGSSVLGGWNWLIKCWEKRSVRKSARAASADIAEVVSRAFESLVEDLQAQARDDRHVIKNLRTEMDALTKRVTATETGEARCMRNLNAVLRHTRECCAIIRDLGRDPPPEPVLESDGRP